MLDLLRIGPPVESSHVQAVPRLGVAMSKRVGVVYTHADGRVTFSGAATRFVAETSASASIRMGSAVRAIVVSVESVHKPAPIVTAKRVLTDDRCCLHRAADHEHFGGSRSSQVKVGGKCTVPGCPCPGWKPKPKALAARVKKSVDK